MTTTENLPSIPPFWLEPAAPPLEIDFGCHRGAFLIEMAIS
jgi:hypothetical protein